MPASSIEPVDLLDLKLLPAWVNEEKNYAHYQGDEGGGPVERASMHPRRGRDRLSREAKPPRGFKKTGEGDRRFPARRGQDRQGKDRHQPVGVVASQVAVHFLPRGPAVENVAAQIKSGSVAYSLFALARLFLEKPERYGVRLAAKPESPLYQLGESGAISPVQPDFGSKECEYVASREIGAHLSRTLNVRSLRSVGGKGRPFQPGSWAVHEH